MGSASLLHQHDLRLPERRLCAGRIQHRHLAVVLAGIELVEIDRDVKSDDGPDPSLCIVFEGMDGRLMAVPFRVAAGAQAPEIGTPVALFAPPLGGALQQGDFRHQYMVSADGQRVLVATVTEEAEWPITLILNWKPRN